MVSAFQPSGKADDDVPEWEYLGSVVRSRLDRSVWVANWPESDYSCFEYAGSLRRVKEATVSACKRADVVETRWERHADGNGFDLQGRSA